MNKSSDLHAICILTRFRNKQLLRLLKKLKECLHNCPYNVSIIIVDNTERAYSHAIEQDITKLNLPALSILHEPKIGIPQGRNSGLVEAIKQQARTIIYIDDDDHPQANWLKELIDCYYRYCHEFDIVYGQILYTLEEPSRRGIDSSLYGDVKRQNNTGDEIFRAATNNVLLDLASLKPIGVFFEERLATCGGSDTDYFDKLRNNGLRIVYCKEAIVQCIVPHSRQTYKWLFQRQFRLGVSYHIRRKLRYGYIVSLLYVAGETFVSINKTFASLFSKDRRIKVLFPAIRVFGMAYSLLGFRYEEYSKIHSDD